MAATFQLVIDCADPEPLARFWAAALRYEFEPPPDGFATWDDYWRDFGLPEEDLGIGEDRIVDPEGRGPGIWFQKVPERKTIKNRLHLDLAPHITDDRDALIDALLARGATRASVGQDEPEASWTVLADPEGNEFCVLSARDN